MLRCVALPFRRRNVAKILVTHLNFHKNKPLYVRSFVAHTAVFIANFLGFFTCKLESKLFYPLCYSFEHGEVVCSEDYAALRMKRDLALRYRATAYDSACSVEALRQFDVMCVAVGTVDRDKERISLASADERHYRIEAFYCLEGAFCKAVHIVAKFAELLIPRDKSLVFVTPRIG